MANQNGFSLVEILIGLTVFALVGIGVLTSLAASARSNITNSDLTEAESLSRAEIEYIQNQPYNAANNGSGCFQESSI